MLFHQHSKNDCTVSRKLVSKRLRRILQNAGQRREHYLLSAMPEHSRWQAATARHQLPTSTWNRPKTRSESTPPGSALIFTAPTPVWIDTATELNFAKAATRQCPQRVVTGRWGVGQLSAQDPSLTHSNSP